MPHVMRFMADVAPERFGAIAEGFGVRFDPDNPRSSALECADRTAKFIGQFEVPTRLRDVNVPHEELSRVAGTVLEELERANSVGAKSPSRAWSRCWKRRTSGQGTSPPTAARAAPREDKNRSASILHFGNLRSG